MKGLSQPDCEPSLIITNTTPLQFNHIAQGLIETNGNITVNPNQSVAFRSNKLKINDGLTVTDGARFKYYNDPCGTNTRGGGFTKSKMLKSNQLFKSGNYEIIKDHLIFNFDLIKEGKVSLEILGNSQLFEFGERSKGVQDVSIPLENLPTDKFYACLKVGVDRYYFEVGL